MGTPFTAHLSEEEMGDRRYGVPYPFDDADLDTNDGRTWRETRAEPAAQLFEKVRALYGVPLAIISFFRSRQHQEALKDAAPDNEAVAQPDTSQHPKGRAMDVRPPAGVTAQQFHDRILVEFRAGRLPELGGLGVYDTFVHLDVRPRPADGTPLGHLARWSGQTHPIDSAA